jgi:hypothetical protein
MRLWERTGRWIVTASTSQDKESILAAVGFYQADKEAEAMQE